MSRIGKKPVSIPKGVTVSIDGQKLSVKGGKGELHLDLRPEVSIEIDGEVATVQANSSDRTARAYQGTTRSLLANMLQGVSQGYEKKLEISGVGYQAAMMGNYIELTLGFNKPVEYTIPSTVTVEVPSPTSIVVSGCDKQQVGQVAAAIRQLRKPEPYKGKGIKYSDEVVKRKAGKAFASGAA
ncbi:MAG: 50S ribosomal protein L6 [Planctomycetota bacterium]|nr:50S ribosomal protein L6 [Planctomycetota bacterium]